MAGGTVLKSLIKRVTKYVIGPGQASFTVIKNGSFSSEPRKETATQGSSLFGLDHQLWRTRNYHDSNFRLQTDGHAVGRSLHYMGQSVEILQARQSLFVAICTTYRRSRWSKN